MEKNRYVKIFFAVPVVRDIGADNTSQILPVKNMVVKVGIGFGYHIFNWYYLTGIIRTCIIIIVGAIWQKSRMFPDHKRTT